MESRTAKKGIKCEGMKYRREIKPIGKGSAGKVMI